MASSQHVQAKTDNGDELNISTHTTDAPLLPVAHLEKLHHFRPDLVDFVVEQTRIEAEYRRKSAIQINTFIFIERMAGTIAALIIAIIGIIAGGYVGLSGQPTLGGSMVAVVVGTLAVAFLGKKQQKEAQEEEAPSSSKKQSAKRLPQKKTSSEK